MNVLFTVLGFAVFLVFIVGAVMIIVGLVLRFGSLGWRSLADGLMRKGAETILISLACVFLLALGLDLVLGMDGIEASDRAGICLIFLAVLVFLFAPWPRRKRGMDTESAE